MYPARTSFEPFFWKCAARNLWAFITASKPTTGAIAAGRLPPPSLDADVGRQHGAERFHVAAAGGGEKSFGKFEAVLLFHLEARSRLADVSSGAAGELAAGRGVALDGGGDFLEREPEHIVQQKGRALERGQAFERQHQRQGDVFLLLLFDDRIGKPGTNIGLALAAR